MMISGVFLFGETFSEKNITVTEAKTEFKNKIDKLNKLIKEVDECTNSATTIEDFDYCGYNSLLLIEWELKKLSSQSEEN
jgi:uncharacterized protein YjaG (DUF416 family)